MVFRRLLNGGAHVTIMLKVVVDSLSMLVDCSHLFV